MSSFLTRALAKTASSLSTTKRRPFLQQPSLFLHSYPAAAATASTGSASRKTTYKLKNPNVYGSTSATTGNPELREKPAPKAWERPSEIPFQAKVSNSVNLIGKVIQPVQFQVSSEGESFAGTVIIQDEASDSLWVPIIFQGDLAHIAACHLKENDCVHVAGQLSGLSGDPPQAGQLSANPPHLNTNKGQPSMQVMVHTLNFVQGYSPTKISFTSQEKEISSQSYAGAKKSGDSELRSWRELLDDPKQWWDYRDKKQSGLVKPRHPDFKSKVSGQALWLESAPKSVWSELEGKFDIQIETRKQVKPPTGDKSWKDLVENPGNWWDNRSRKMTAKSPDFRHKETGEALWLSNSPSWVPSKLLPLTSKQDATFGKRDIALLRPEQDGI